jgi:hypothetical protein
MTAGDVSERGPSTDPSHPSVPPVRGMRVPARAATVGPTFAVRDAESPGTVRDGRAGHERPVSAVSGAPRVPTSPDPGDECSAFGLVRIGVIARSPAVRRPIPIR